MANVVRRAASISAAGGQPDTLYLHPSDYMALQLAVGADDRPLIQPDAQLGGGVTIAGMRVSPTPAIGGGTALVAEAKQIVVAVGTDATLSSASESEFE